MAELLLRGSRHKAEVQLLISIYLGKFTWFTLKELPRVQLAAGATAIMTLLQLSGASKSSCKNWFWPHASLAQLSARCH